MDPIKEPDLQQLYSEQRALDRERAPSFARVWQAAAERKHVPFTWWPVLLPATACAALLLASALVFWPAPPKQTASSPGALVVATAWSEWTSPTAALLDSLHETNPN